jgi:hypothetical protein
MKVGDLEYHVSRGRRVCVRALRIAGYLFFVYATTYFLAMNTACPAFDPATGNVAYDSCYLFGPTYQRPGGLTIIYGAQCWANRVFWPMDCLVQPWLKPCNRVARDLELQDRNSGR